MNTNWSRRLSVAVGAAFLVAACSAPPAATPTATEPAQPASQAPAASASAAPETVKVTFRHSFIPDEQYIPFGVAKELGYFAEEGIEFEEQIGDGGATAVKLVANGDVMFGNGEAAHVIRALDRGVPIVAVATQVQSVSGAVLTHADSGLTTIADLKGKTVAGSVTSSTYTFFKVALGLSGLSESDVNFLGVAAPADTQAFLEGRADGITSFAAGAGALRAEGIETNTVSFLSAGVKAPSTVIFASPFTVRDNPELVERFVRAVLKGLRYAVENPEEAVDLTVKSYPDLDRASLLARWEIGLPFTVSDVTEAEGIGWHDEGSWASNLTILADAGEVSAEVDVTKGYTFDILERIDKADR